MKKFLLSFLLSAAITFAIGQPSTPCVADYKITNGGGSCPKNADGVKATGTITLTFDGTVDPNVLPQLIGVTDITDPNNPITVTGITFGDAQLNNNGTATFCYYTGPNNNNDLGGHNSQFSFIVGYEVNGNLVTCAGSPIPLPVNFKSFTATRSSGVVNLKWTSASELNNSGYEVQRLIGVGTWQTISFVGTQATAGNSASELSYTFTDQNPTKGVTQYRIKQVDIDQRARFSEIRAVRGLGQLGKTIVYPNPSFGGSKVNVIFDEKDGTRDVSLIDMSGRVIRQWKGFTNNNLQIENLTPGLYNLRVVLRETGEQGIEKIVVNKN